MAARAPALFVSHGAPTELIGRGPWQTSLEILGRIDRPKAVVVMSAHWRTKSGFDIAFQSNFETIHDFSGFPEELSRFQYPAHGDLSLSKKCVELLSGAAMPSTLCETRGLDHGVYVPLHHMFRNADVPIIPIAINARATPQEIFRAGEILSPLRDEGVMICGSGGIVHNLGELSWDDQGRALPEPWASGFQTWVVETLDRRDYGSLCDFQTMAPEARRAHPTWEHFAPLLFVAGATSRFDALREVVFDDWTFGNLSMATWVYR